MLEILQRTCRSPSHGLIGVARELEKPLHRAWEFAPNEDQKLFFQRKGVGRFHDYPCRGFNIWLRPRSPCAGLPLLFAFSQSIKQSCRARIILNHGANGCYVTLGLAQN
ncbi:MAG: hypothetical protein ABI972_28140 [Acidobacteriota bacterium]